MRDHRLIVITLKFQGTLRDLSKSGRNVSVNQSDQVFIFGTITSILYEIKLHVISADSSLILLWKSYFFLVLSVFFRGLRR